NPSRQPLDAEIFLYRMDDESPIYRTTVTTLASEGGAYQVELPQASYLFRVFSLRYITDSALVTIDAQSVNLDFILDTTRASILLVDDDSGKRSIDKNDRFLNKDIVINEAEKGQSASEIQDILESLGYYILKTGFNEETANKLNEFNMVISSSGSNMSPVAEDSCRLMLEQYVENGGKLLIEGGEVGYDAAYEQGYSSFKENVLHIEEWNADTAKSLYRLVTDHDLVTQPNALPPEIVINYSSCGDEDACTPTSDTHIIYYNNGKPSQGGIILYEDAESIYGAKVIFYTFAFDKLADEIVQKNLLENTIEFLLAEPCLLKGDVNKDGSVNILDMVKIVNFILYPDQQPDDYERWAADLNSDQDINVLDLVWVINKLLGREGFAKPTDFMEGKLEIFQQNGQIRYKASKPIAGLEIQFDSDCYPVFSNRILENNMITSRAEKNKLLLYSVNGNDIL
ncbi:MAG: dockerin type I repeat-containing protein, partial [Candidatus Marinimicrobia bacterium]|nr:dockerin type I repeat-containing protein [Candidatus Neomarinimicrobiota bacterium]